MAEDIEQEALATLVVNKLRGTLKVRGDMGGEEGMCGESGQRGEGGEVRRGCEQYWIWAMATASVTSDFDV